MLAKEDVRPRRFGGCAVLHFVVCVVLAAVAEAKFRVGREGRGGWLAGLPVATGASLALLWAPGLTGRGRDAAQVRPTDIN
jgi:hypothetical protein